MPELPEVETVKRILEQQIVGLLIESATVKHERVIAHPAAGTFILAVAGQTICGIGRRGKFLQILLAGGATIILHLRMTGCLLVTPAGYAVEKHTHIIFHLHGGRELHFIDPRRFGRFWFIKAGEDDTYSGIGKLGPEPLSDALSAEYLLASYGKSRKPVKACLLEQNVIAGIGNIYSDEILFKAKIRPDRPANSLKTDEWRSLAWLIPERLSYFTEKNIITPEEYFACRGQDYRNTPFLQVYGREGKGCLVCGKTLCRQVVTGRSSIFCPTCQV